MHAKKKNEKGAFWGILLLVIAALLFLYAKKDSSRSRTTELRQPLNSEYISGTVQENVNRNLRDTSNNIEEQNMIGKAVNNVQNKNVRDLAPYNIQDGKKPLKIDPEVTGPSISETQLDGGKSVDYTTPRQVIQMELADKQIEARAQEEFRQEYIKQFVENAKKGGWRVEVDSKGNILGVYPIKKNREYNIFSPTANSSQ
jgi:hypothetical protein